MKVRTTGKFVHVCEIEHKTVIKVVNFSIAVILRFSDGTWTVIYGYQSENKYAVTACDVGILENDTGRELRMFLLAGVITEEEYQRLYKEIDHEVKEKRRRWYEELRKEFEGDAQ
jgi:hypothetical protein